MREDIKNLISDEGFRKECEAASNLDEIISLFAAKGVVVTADELKGFAGDELSEEELTDVAGGLSFWDAINPGYWLGRLVKWKTGFPGCGC